VYQNKTDRNSFQFPLVKKVVMGLPWMPCRLFFCAYVSKFSTWRFLSPGVVAEKICEGLPLKKSGRWWSGSFANFFVTEFSICRFFSPDLEAEKD